MLGLHHMHFKLNYSLHYLKKKIVVLLMNLLFLKNDFKNHLNYSSIYVLLVFGVFVFLTNWHINLLDMNHFDFHLNHYYF